MRSRRGRITPALAPALLALAASACSQTVIVRSDGPAHVIVDENDLGLVGEEGVPVEVPVGLFAVPYVVERDGQKVEGEIPRSRPAWLPNTVGLCAPFLMAPACACCGATVANPQLFATPLLGVICALNPEVACTSCYGMCAGLVLSPGWLSVPLGCGGLAIGSLPLALLGFGTLPDEVVLVGPRPGDKAPPTSSTKEAMAW